MDVKLKAGDIIVDVVTNDVGLLLTRYCLLGDLDVNNLGPFESDYYTNINIWAWDVFWVGGSSVNSETSRYQPYTESGLVNLIKTGTFILNGNKRHE